MMIFSLNFIPLLVAGWWWPGWLDIGVEVEVLCESDKQVTRDQNRFSPSLTHSHTTLILDLMARKLSLSLPLSLSPRMK